MNHYQLKRQGNKFDFLSQDEMTALMKEYYEDRISMTSLKVKYKLPQNNNFELQFPWTQTAETCSLCNCQMVVVPHHRDCNLNKPVCSDCGHINDGYCACSTCREIEYQSYLQEKKEREERISNQLQLEESVKIPFDKLTAEEKISLGMVVRNMSSEDLTYIVPFSSKENWKNNKDFVLPLYKSKILTVHPESDYNSIEVKENKFKETILTFELHKMKWNINVLKEDLSNYELYNYLARAEDQLKLTNEELFLYWKKIAKHEAQLYLAYNFSQVLKIEFENDFAIDNLLEYLTNHFSIGQIYNLIWKYTNNTLRFKEERQVTINHIYNYLLKCIRNEAEKIIENKYNLAHFEKPKYIQQSSFSDFFFSYILKTNGQGYRITPSEIFGINQNNLDNSQEFVQFKTVGDYLNTYKFLSTNKEPFKDEEE
ncbi:hypothetical protein QLS91_17035 [Flavobacterium sp. LB2P84]|uniref:hypothetical protein n=1 Tax=Flavobacterium yafengii TaxID=3041253 RepID=UPI0024A82F54|nr:hypothetical protein [Flavobacterium yafengii]MDI6034784.1 hypothetical protein [Flavobacterium yafengii]